MANRKNVQEQNDFSKSSIEKSAYYWRSNRLPDYLIEVFKSKAIDINTSIMLDYDHNYPGMPSDFGLILTVDKVFLSFELEYSNNETSIERWEDVSDRYLISDNEKGFKKTYGYLACEVLQEINSEG